MSDLEDRDYRRLLELRTALRRFLHWSEDRAKAAGLTPMQHQLLLAIRGHADGAPTVGDVAAALLLRPHSATELVARAERAGLIRRERDEHDQRIVRLALTKVGAARLEQLSRLHLDEIDRLTSRLRLDAPIP